MSQVLLFQGIGEFPAPKSQPRLEGTPQRSLHFKAKRIAPPAAQTDAIQIAVNFGRDGIKSIPTAGVQGVQS